jgi:hypothetical protein
VIKPNHFHFSSFTVSYLMKGTARDCRLVTKQEKWVKCFKRRTSLKKTTPESGRDEVRPYIKILFIEAAVEVKIRLRRRIKSSGTLRYVD